MNLNKCPKCGGTAKLYRYGQNFYTVECRECGHKVEGDTFEEAVNGWNRSAKNADR